MFTGLGQFQFQLSVKEITLPSKMVRLLMMIAYCILGRTGRQGPYFREKIVIFDTLYAQNPCSFKAVRACIAVRLTS